MDIIATVNAQRAQAYANADAQRAQAYRLAGDNEDALLAASSAFARACDAADAEYWKALTAICDDIVDAVRG
jgi:hypothetical protein